MAKCPHCKQTVTLDRAQREVATAADEVHKDVVGFGFFFGGLLTGRP